MNHLQLTIEGVKNAIEDAKEEESQLLDGVMQISGMSGYKTRHLYNNILKNANKDLNRKINYLEIGCHQGSSTVAALYNNDVNATVIDNWSEFGNVQTKFEQNMKKFVEPDSKNAHWTFITDDCFKCSLPKDTKFDVYLYDGRHDQIDHEMAITHFWNNLADKCILLIDDYNVDWIQKGTEDGLTKVNCDILYQEHVRSKKRADRTGFWDGCGVFLVQKH